MKIQLQGSSLFMGGSSIFRNSGLKSTQEKLQRKEQRDNQIAFLENQKSSLKNMECKSFEEISRKLELFHSYEDQITAAKEAYNQSQMFCVMDEARERGEQIAKAAEKYAPKTPEERKAEALEEMAAEALGTDESEGMDALEELAELAAEAAEEMTGDIAELSETLSQEAAPQEELPQEELEEMVSSEADKMYGAYTRVDIRI